MSGILDNKTRVVDVLLTQEGRRQLAFGQMQIKYVAFTDDATHYKADLASGSADATERIFLETCNLPQDQVTFEAFDGGRLNSFKNVSGLSVRDGRIISSSFDNSLLVITTGSGGSVIINNSGSNVISEFLTGSIFASTSDALLNGSSDSFNKLRIIGTKGRLFDENEFQMTSGQVNIKLTPTLPIDKRVSKVSINHLEGLISDIRLSTQKNFKFLPPVNKVTNLSLDKKNVESLKQFYLADYEPWGPTTPLTPQKLHEHVSDCEKKGLTRTAHFNPTSKNNNLFGQFFEIKADELKKLDVIDYGRHVYEFEGVSYNRHYFFAGRVLTDDNGDDTFVHLFTLIFM